MTCIKAQSMITQFINNKLNVKELEEFLEHVEACPNCMEELEIYYTLLTAMRQLDEDKNLSVNYKDELSNKLKRAQDKIVHIRYAHYRKITLLIIFMLSLAFVLGIRYAEVSIENKMNNRNCMIRMFRDERYDYASMKLDDYCRQEGVNKVPLPDDEDIAYILR